jgi:hypothetical protein
MRIYIYIYIYTTIENVKVTPEFGSDTMRRLRRRSKAPEEQEAAGSVNPARPPGI